MKYLIFQSNNIAFYYSRTQDHSLKGTHTISMKNDNPETSILLLKPWNYLCNRQYRIPTLSGGPPFSATCACVYNQER